MLRQRRRQRQAFESSFRWREAAALIDIVHWHEAGIRVASTKLRLPVSLGCALAAAGVQQLRLSATPRPCLHGASPAAGPPPHPAPPPPAARRAASLHCLGPAAGRAGRQTAPPESGPGTAAPHPAAPSLGPCDCGGVWGCWVRRCSRLFTESIEPAPAICCRPLQP